MTSRTRADLRIGTRGSPLALAQARMVRDRLAAAHPGIEIELLVIRTTGDRVQDRTLAEIGGKGLFTKEIEEALLVRRIDLAVHSLKDMQTVLPGGLAIGATLTREDPRDAFLSPVADRPGTLAPGAVVGTASLRRQAQLLAARPDLTVVPLRGNVETRLRKLEAGEVDATLLAMAGLKRLGRSGAATAVLEPEEMLPAVGQGAIGLEIRDGDARVADLVAPLDDPATAVCVRAERAFLAALDGSCRTPIAAFAELDADGGVVLRGLVARPDGVEVHRVRRRAAANEAEEMGREAGRALKARIGAGFLA